MKPPNGPSKLIGAPLRAILLGSLLLLGGFVLNEMRVRQPITPLRLFADRVRAGAYLGRTLVVGGLFSMFFFLSQYLQGVHGYSALGTGIAFLPMTTVMFAMVRLGPRLAATIGNRVLLSGGVAVAAAGMAWMSRLSETGGYFPQIAVPLVVVGAGIGASYAPLTALGITGVAREDAGTAAGLVNAAQQLGGSLGLGVLVTVFASAGAAAVRHLPAGATAGQIAAAGLAHGTATALLGSTVLLALALLVSVTMIRLRDPAQHPETRTPASRRVRGQ